MVNLMSSVNKDNYNGKADFVSKLKVWHQNNDKYLFEMLYVNRHVKIKKKTWQK